ncbi:DUF2971 domain-containing protein [Bacillus inaquosorum]|uniref:DUF2971 domain-containing protein n=1 Tax=Bacillus inaquosorum TaxID=483913 RepID=UPI003D01993F
MDSYYGNTVYTDEFMYEVMQIYELPKYLYHYTSIETFALILKNNTLRFNRLDKVNDVNEAISFNFPYANTAVFTSSWTSHKDESIPMWRLYTQNMDGVRIKLPVNMFKGRKNPHVFEKGGSRIQHDEAVTIKRKKLEYKFHTSGIQGPNKIHYTNDKELLQKEVLCNQEGYISTSLYDLGMFKQKCWEYEQEWRFKILAFFEEFNLPNDEFTNKVLDLKTYPIMNTFIDVPLESGIFNEAELILGPKTTQGQYIILESLVEKYSPNAKIRRSRLQLR